MRLTLLIALLSSQINIYAQKELVGQVYYYKYNSSLYGSFESLSDEEINQLNSSTHNVRIMQADEVVNFKTNSDGLFNFKLHSKDSIKIIVNNGTAHLRGEFKLHPKDIKDSLQLKISDRKIAIYRDSIQEPQFHKRFSPQQAELNYRNGFYQVLGLGLDETTSNTSDKYKRIEKEYGVNYYLIPEPNVPTARIMFRYNQVMKQLIGIEEHLW